MEESNPEKRGRFEPFSSFFIFLLPLPPRSDFWSLQSSRPAVPER
jgi:hypothetical protein